MYRGMARALAEAEENESGQAEGFAYIGEGVCGREIGTRRMVMVARIFNAFEWGYAAPVWNFTGVTSSRPL